MERENNLQQEVKDKQNLLDYIKKNSRTLVVKEKFTEELEKMARPGKAMIGYYDSDNVNFSVEGYDLVYFSDDGEDLCHVKIKPEEIDGLENKGKIGESDEIEDVLRGNGFVLDQSEEFRAALHRQLNG